MLDVLEYRTEDRWGVRHYLEGQWKTTMLRSRPSDDRPSDEDRVMARQVGMMCPPDWFNYCAGELVRASSGALDVMNTQMRLGPDFEYELKNILGAVEEMVTCCQMLAGSDVELVAQVGTPFTTAHGWRGGGEIERAMSQRCGVAVEMMGLSVARVCHELGVATATVCTVYYQPDWTQSYRDFLAQAGIEVLFAGAFEDLGTAAQVTTEESCHHLFDPEVLVESVRRCCERAPAAEAVIISGIPCPQLELLAQLEEVAERPVINYLALHARVLKRLGLPATGIRGAMFEL